MADDASSSDDYDASEIDFADADLDKIEEEARQSADERSKQTAKHKGKTNLKVAPLMQKKLSDASSSSAGATKRLEKERKQVCTFPRKHLDTV